MPVAGRPSYLNPRVEHAIADLVAQGVPPTVAGRYLGIPERTLLRWIFHGRRDHREPYQSFVQSIDQAKLEHQARVRELAQDAGARL